MMEKKQMAQTGFGTGLEGASGGTTAAEALALAEDADFRHLQRIGADAKSQLANGLIFFDHSNWEHLFVCRKAELFLHAKHFFLPLASHQDVVGVNLGVVADRCAEHCL